MNIEEAKELKRKAEADITRILYELAGKIKPSRMDVLFDVDTITDSSGTRWEQRIASIAVRINMDI